MKSKLVGLIALLAGSEAIGVLLGTWFFKLFEQTVPPAVLTNFNKATAKGAFLGYGARVRSSSPGWSPRSPRRSSSAAAPGPRAHRASP